MALHAIAILSTSRACLDLPPSLTTPTIPETTPTKTKSSSSKSHATNPTPASDGGQKVMRLTPCPSNNYFCLFIVELLKMFDRDNRVLLDRKGNFIVRYALCSGGMSLHSVIIGTTACVCKQIVVVMHAVLSMRYNYFG